MARGKGLSFGNVILCDYAALGYGNKHILVNCYSGNIVVQAFPARLGFCLYLELLEGQRDCDSITLELCIGKDKLAEIAVVIQERDPDEPSAVVVPTFTLSLERPCDFIVWASSLGFIRKRILSKKIMLPRRALAAV